MARPKKPTELKKRQGTYRSSRANKNEPTPEILIPDPPDHLEGDSLKEWDRITPILYKNGLISELDTAELAAYCCCFARWREAERHIKENGLTEITSNGNIIQSPYVGIANTAMKQMHQFLCQFGMTPASRASVIKETQEDPNNPLLEFLRTS